MQITLTRQSNNTKSLRACFLWTRNLIFLGLSIAFLSPQLVYAEQLYITSAKSNVSKLKTYSAPKSKAKLGSIDVKLIKEFSNNGRIKVEEEKMNGRFLFVNINNNDVWIKAKQVNTTQKFDLGKCDKASNVTGIRGAVNCQK